MPTQLESFPGALRQFLGAVLPTDADLEALCQDYFTDVAARFTNGMDRLAKTNLLLSMESPQDILAATRKYSPDRYVRFRHLVSEFSTTQANPYRGLAAFQVDEAHLFFGRELLTKKLRQRFDEIYTSEVRTRLLAVLGPSGSGKSSAVRAGLLANLYQQPIADSQPPRVAVLVPGEYPLENLARALVPILPADNSVLAANRQTDIEKLFDHRDAQHCSDGLRRFARDLPEITKNPLVIFIDQFEEIYTLCNNSTQRDTFVDLLLNAAEDRSRVVTIVITLRSDFLGQTQKHHPRLNHLFGEQSVLVTVMGQDELRRVIAEPARASGHPIDEATVDLLMAEAKDSEGSLPLLEFALTRIWEGILAGRHPSVTLRESGGVGGVLAYRAQQIFDALPAHEQRIARRVLLRLVQLGEGTSDTRRRVRISQLVSHGETKEKVQAILGRFADHSARLVTLGWVDTDGSEDGVAEITHEALLEHWHTLRQWLNESRADLRFHNRLQLAASDWHSRDEPPGLLWRSPDLDLLRHYYRRNADELTSLQASFFTHSLRQARKESLFRVFTICAVAGLGLFLLGLWIKKERELRAAAQTLGIAERGLRAEALATRPGHRLEALVAGLSAVNADIEHGRRTPGTWQGVTMAAYQQVFAKIIHVQTSPVKAIAYSPNGTQLAAANQDGTVHVLKPESGDIVFSLRGHRGPVNAVVYASDGKKIATAGSDGTVRIWSAETGYQEFIINPQTSTVNTVLFSPNNNHIIAGQFDGKTTLWDITSNRLLLTFPAHTASVWTACYSPDGQRIATGSDDGVVLISDALTGRLLMTLAGHSLAVSSVVYSPDGKRILTAGFDNIARIWDADNGVSLRIFDNHRGSVNSAYFSPDGKKIITTSWDRIIRVWSIRTGNLLFSLEGHNDTVLSARFSPDGRHIASAGTDGTVRVWDHYYGRAVLSLEGHEDQVTSVTYAPNAKYVATASADTTVRIWHPMTGRELQKLHGHRGIVNSVSYSPDSSVIVTASDDGTARIWDPGAGTMLKLLNDHQGRVLSAEFSADSNYVVTISTDRNIRIWNAKLGTLEASWKNPSSASAEAQFSPDGKQVITANTDSTATIWDRQSGKAVQILRNHQESLTKARFSPNGAYVLTASNDRTAFLWDGPNYVTGLRLQGHTNWVSAVAFSHNSAFVATASWDRTVRLWQISDKHLLLSFEAHNDRIRDIVFSPDGKRIATASDDGLAQIWSTDYDEIFDYGCSIIHTYDSVKIPFAEADSVREALSRCRVKQGLIFRED